VRACVCEKDRRGGMNRWFAVQVGVVVGACAYTCMYVNKREIVVVNNL